VKTRQYLPALVLALAMAGCSAPSTSDPSGPPTLPEAEAFLAQVVSLAQRGDFTALCALGDLNCKRSLDTAGRNTVPPAPPTVIGSRPVPSTTSGDQQSIGGMVLALCGRNATGAQYHSEMLVFRDSTGLRAINPVYWDNTMIAAGRTTPDSPMPSTAC
jgi:hypothetical protein